MKSRILSALAILTMLFLNSAPAQLLLNVESGPAGAPCRRGELIVQFRNDVTDAQVSGAFNRAGWSFIKHVQTPAMADRGQIGLTLVETPLPVEAALRALPNLPGVAFVEPNWIYTTGADSNDPLYLDGSLWGMYGDDLPSPVGPFATSNLYGSQVEKAWAVGLTGSRTVCVGIIDQGIQFDHPDLAANIWTNPGEIPGNGIDDDGDGYVDDVHGWNALNDNGTIYDGTDAHGTHVSGTIGAMGGNGLGVAGVNWNVTLISGKFLGSDNTGATLDAIQAIDYMTVLRTRKGLNITVLNNSWGGAAFSQALLDSIGRAASAGILFAVAAMNSNTNIDLSPRYPACYDTTSAAGYDAVISVAALDKDGNKAGFSDYGLNSVDLGAPGSNVVSTVPTNSYALRSGTSMATPHVAGAVALYASLYPAAAAADIRDTLLTTGVTPTPSLNGITVTGGRLAVDKFIASGPVAAPIPAAPSSLQVRVVSGGRVDLTWTDLSDNELGFGIERSSDGMNYSLADTVGANYTAASDRTVRPSTTNYYRIHSYNSSGSSDYVYAPGPVATPYVAPPAAPSGLTATALARGGVNLAWTDKSNSEEGFQIERQSSSSNWQTLTVVDPNTVAYVDATTVKLTTYSYRVRSFNAAGPSAYSNEAKVKSK